MPNTVSSHENACKTTCLTDVKVT